MTVFGKRPGPCPGNGHKLSAFSGAACFSRESALDKNISYSPVFLFGSKIIKAIAPDSFLLLMPGEDGYEIINPPGQDPSPSGKEQDDGAPDENTIERI